MDRWQRPKEHRKTTAAINQTYGDAVDDFIAVEHQPDSQSWRERPLTEKIRQENENSKRINGHPPEYVAASLDLPVEELFPLDGLTLYVGDPWQKLDRPGVVIVDYEFGPVVEFQDDRDKYLNTLDYRIEEIDSQFIIQRDPAIQQFLEREVPIVRQLYQQVLSQSILEYERIANDFLAMKLRIEEEIQRQSNKSGDPIYAIDKALRDLWYVAVHGARAMDVFDWATQLEEPYLAFIDNLPKTLPKNKREQQMQHERRQLIENIRLKKTTQEAQVVQAMFPFLPFRNETFDRFVAFWSISTYVFPSLNDNDMTSYWAEIYRVLKPGGKAYVAPLFEANDYILYNSLTQYGVLHPDFNFSIDDRGLIITKSEVKISTKKTKDSR